MAALSLLDVKGYLRLPSGTTEDAYLTDLIAASARMICDQTGKNKAGQNDIATDDLFKQAQRQIIAEWYSNRETAVAGSTAELPNSATAIIQQIKLSGSYKYVEASQ